MAPSIAEMPTESPTTPTPAPSTKATFQTKLNTTVNSKTTLETVIRENELVPLWNTGAPSAPPYPHSKHIPAVWKYEVTKSLLLRAAELVDAKEAERRAVLMINPGPRQPPLTLDTILAAHQLLVPGEQAVCHRHTPFAVRFLIEGDKGYTAISGKKMYMKPGDLIITPVWNWHDHGNEGTNNVIWLDGLNIPLFKHIPVDFTEHYDEIYGVSTHESRTVPDSEAAKMKFPWSQTQARLDAIAAAGTGSAADFAETEYLLPNGKSVSTTIGAYATKIAAGRMRPALQETASRIYQVHAGSGRTELTSPSGGNGSGSSGKKEEKSYTLTWSKGDSFCVPAWYRYTIHADDDDDDDDAAGGAGEDAYLFSFSDKPMQDALGFYRSKE